MLAKRLLVLDLETTGLDPSSDSIVQIASCVLSRQELIEEGSFSSYIRPECPISPQAAAVHGLSYSDLSTAPTLTEAIHAFAEYAPSHVIVSGHNVSFDVAFLREAYRRVARSFPFDYHTLDLWSIAYFILGAQRISLRAYDLSSLCALYGIKRDRKHDALEDVRATSNVLRQLFKAVREEKLEVKGQLKLFSKR